MSTIIGPTGTPNAPARDTTQDAAGIPTSGPLPTTTTTAAPAKPTSVAVPMKDEIDLGPKPNSAAPAKPAQFNGKVEAGGTVDFKKLPADEQYIYSKHGEAALRNVQKGKAALAEAKRDLAEAHRIYKTTGKITQTKHAFSWIEIKEGRLMDRAERYDAMLKKQGKDRAHMGDVVADRRDPEYLTKEEFDDEFRSRVKAEKDHCKDEYIRPGKINKCVKAVEEKYGGPGFKGWRDKKDKETYQQIQRTGQKINNVKNSGPGSLVGRIIGRAIGGEKGEEIGAMIGGGFDLAGRGKAVRGQNSGYEKTSTGNGKPAPAEIRPKTPTGPAPSKSNTTGTPPNAKPPSNPPSNPTSGKPPVNNSPAPKPAPKPADTPVSNKPSKSNPSKTGPQTADASVPAQKPANGEQKPDPYGVVPPSRPSARVTVQTSKGPKEMSHAEYSNNWKAANRWVLQEARNMATEARRKDPYTHITPSSFHAELEKRAQVAWGLRDNWRFRGNDPDRWNK